MLETSFEIVRTLFAGAIGFGAKWLLDYYYLRSPRIVAFVKLTNQSYTRSTNDTVMCHLKANVEFHSHSKNDAYGITVLELTSSEPIIIISLPKTDRKALSESTTLLAPFEFQAAFQTNEKSIQILQLLQSANPEFKLTISYYNQFGRKYTKILKASLLDEPGFEFWVG